MSLYLHSLLIIYAIPNLNMIFFPKIVDINVYLLDSLITIIFSMYEGSLIDALYTALLNP
jgi:hypothetical protein